MELCLYMWFKRCICIRAIFKANFWNVISLTVVTVLQRNDVNLSNYIKVIKSTYTKSKRQVPKISYWITWICAKTISFTMVTMCLYMGRQTLGGLKEDFTEPEHEVLGNDSVWRIINLDKTSTSFPPVGDKRLTVGTSEASITTNVNRWRSI